MIPYSMTRREVGRGEADHSPSTPRHVPVLLHEVIAFLAPKPGEFVIDGTLGGGGHSAAILEHITPGGKLLGVDWDRDAIAAFRKRIAAIPNSQFLIPKTLLVHGNYADLPEILRKRGLPKADGLLLDIGFSSDQLAQSDRGFSFLRDEPLIMTYDARRKPVKELLRTMREEELAGVIAAYGEERFARRIARAIVARRPVRGNPPKADAGTSGFRASNGVHPVETSAELAEVVRQAVPVRYARSRIHPATRTFQALRVYANDELGNLDRALAHLPDILKPGGRIVVISFHSLEDRIVKRRFNEYTREGMLKILVKKPVIPMPEEIRVNPRSRSAKLRAAILAIRK